MLPKTYEIKKTNFEAKTRALKQFSEELPDAPVFEKFKTHGFLFSHKVTGDELNGFVAQVQDCLIDINEHNRKLVKEFGQVYETFEVLDKEYINGILIGVESAKTASQEAKKAQKDANKTIALLQTTVQKLKEVTESLSEFKNEVNQYEHLADIDILWDDVGKLDKTIKSISAEIQEISANLRKCADKLDGIEKKVDPALEVLQTEIDNLSRFKEEINRYTHLADIDTMWQQLEKYEAQMETYKNNDLQLSRQVKLAYLVAGSALLLAAGHFIMSWAGNA